MRWVKLTAFLSLWAIFFALVAVAHLWITLLRLTGRWKIISRLTCLFTYLLRMILNIKVTLVGDGTHLERGGYFIISNHVSYVDGIVLGSIFPVVFVSKKEVKSWPIIGQWTTLCGTIFINRQRKDKIALLVKEIVGKLKQEANILLFPEGTSTDGERMLPFQSAPFAAPLRARATIVPISLAYKSINDEPVSARNHDSVYWYGEMDFLSHFWRLLALRSVEVIVTIQPTLETCRYENDSAGRKKLSQDCYDKVLGKKSKWDGMDEGGESCVEEHPATLTS